MCTEGATVCSAFYEFPAAFTVCKFPVTVCAEFSNLRSYVLSFGCLFEVKFYS
jgi:hypothetical protein